MSLRCNATCFYRTMECLSFIVYLKKHTKNLITKQLWWFLILVSEEETPVKMPLLCSNISFYSKYAF